MTKIERAKMVKVLAKTKGTLHVLDTIIGLEKVEDPMTMLAGREVLRDAVELLSDIMGG